mmetsp:Transcript_49484/g.152717  ORF Transcript_49484/g.152717 Transcript_49484/m.152717 type:complete len:290 (+) Transcript_49484:205-1074(+)
MFAAAFSISSRSDGDGRTPTNPAVPPAFPPPPLLPTVPLAPSSRRCCLLAGAASSAVISATTSPVPSPRPVSPMASKWRADETSCFIATPSTQRPTPAATLPLRDGATMAPHSGSSHTESGSCGNATGCARSALAPRVHALTRNVRKRVFATTIGALASVGSISAGTCPSIAEPNDASAATAHRWPAAASALGNVRVATSRPDESPGLPDAAAFSAPSSSIDTVFCFARVASEASSRVRILTLPALRSVIGATGDHPRQHSAGLFAGGTKVRRDLGAATASWHRVLTTG